MYCINCGKELKEEWKICPWCGHKSKIKNQREMYLLFPKMNGIGRERINTILFIIAKVVEVWSGLLIWSHIYNEIKADEGYKILVYVIRFFNMCGPYIICYTLIEEIQKFMKLKRNEIKEKYSYKTVLAAELICVFTELLAWGIWMNPSEAEMWETFAVVAGGTLLDYLWSIKGVVILLLISGIVGGVIDGKMIIKKEEK